MVGALEVQTEADLMASLADVNALHGAAVRAVYRAILEVIGDLASAEVAVNLVLCRDHGEAVVIALGKNFGAARPASATGNAFITIDCYLDHQWSPSAL